jgi:hypothetical protein
VDSNELVNAWLLQQFRDSNPLIGVTPDAVEDHRHLIRCRSTRVVSREHGWECGCYSEYTRDDVWRVEARFECEHRIQAAWSLEPVLWGSLPDVIAAIRGADFERFECPMEEQR